MRLSRIIIFVALMLIHAVVAAQDCYESSILSPTPFMGNDGEIFKLADGSIWKVMYEYEYMYEYYPKVIVCPSKGKIAVGSKMLNVQKIGGGKPTPKANAEKNPTPEIIESRIDGEFSGWEGETIFKLMNGQIWQQIDGRYKYKYKYSPKVIIFRSGAGFEMQVEGVDGRIRVSRLK
jgi:hypothetical protein